MPSRLMHSQKACVAIWAPSYPRLLRLAVWHLPDRRFPSPRSWTTTCSFGALPIRESLQPPTRSWKAGDFRTVFRRHLRTRSGPFLGARVPRALPPPTSAAATTATARTGTPPRRPRAPPPSHPRLRPLRLSPWPRTVGLRVRRRTESSSRLSRSWALTQLAGGHGSARCCGSTRCRPSLLGLQSRQAMSHSGARAPQLRRPILSSLGVLRRLCRSAAVAACARQPQAEPS